jgi:hypothetical protein
MDFVTRSKEGSNAREQASPLCLRLQACDLVGPVLLLARSSKRSFHERVGRNTGSRQFSAFSSNQKSLPGQGPDARRTEGARRQNLDDLPFAEDEARLQAALSAEKSASP